MPGDKKGNLEGINFNPEMKKGVFKKFKEYSDLYHCKYL